MQILPERSRSAVWRSGFAAACLVCGNSHLRSRTEGPHSRFVSQQRSNHFTPKPTSAISDLCIIEEGKTVISCSRDGTVIRWVCGTSEVLFRHNFELGPCTSLSLSSGQSAILQQRFQFQSLQISDCSKVLVTCELGYGVLTAEGKEVRGKGIHFNCQIAMFRYSPCEARSPCRPAASAWMDRTCSWAVNDSFSRSTSKAGIWKMKMR